MGGAAMSDMPGADEYRAGRELGQAPYTFPRGGVSLKWEFAARENMPPVAVYWSDNGELYTPEGMSVEQMRRKQFREANKALALPIGQFAVEEVRWLWPEKIRFFRDFSGWLSKAG